MKTKGEYARIINRFDRAQEKLRRQKEQHVKQFIKKRALACGVDMTNTQHSLGSILPYEEELQRKKFQAFQDFIIHLADYHKVEFYFTIDNGKFRWL